MFMKYLTKFPFYRECVSMGAALPTHNQTSAATTGSSAPTVLNPKANPVVKAGPTPEEIDKEWKARIYADYSDYGCQAVLCRGCSCIKCHPPPGGGT